jgi:hypothetical protein
VNSEDEMRLRTSEPNIEHLFLAGARYSSGLLAGDQSGPPLSVRALTGDKQQLSMNTQKFFFCLFVCFF